MPGNAFHILVALHCISLVSCFKLTTNIFPHSRWLFCDFLYGFKATLVWTTFWWQGTHELSLCDTGLLHPFFGGGQGGLLLLFSPHPPKRSSVLADPIETRTSCGYSERSCGWPLWSYISLNAGKGLWQRGRSQHRILLSSRSFTGIKVKALNIIVVPLALRQGCDSWGRGKTSRWSGRGGC